MQLLSDFEKVVSGFILAVKGLVEREMLFADVENRIPVRVEKVLPSGQREGLAFDLERCVVAAGALDVERITREREDLLFQDERFRALGNKPWEDANRPWRRSELSDCHVALRVTEFDGFRALGTNVAEMRGLTG